MEIDIKKLLVADGRHMREPIPPATEADVASFEEIIGSRLPEDYRQFLLTVNGGSADTSIVGSVFFECSELLDESAGKTEDVSLGQLLTLYDGLDELLDTGYGLTLASAYEDYITLEPGGFPHVPPDCIPIAAVDSSEYILLVLDGIYKNKILYFGHMYYGDADHLYENVRLAGNSFTDFMNSIYADPGVSSAKLVYR